MLGRARTPIKIKVLLLFLFFNINYLRLILYFLLELLNFFIKIVYLIYKGRTPTYTLRLMTKASFKERGLLGATRKEAAGKAVSEEGVCFPYKEVIKTRAGIPTLSVNYNSFLFP